MLLTLLGVGGTDGAVLANRTTVGVYIAEKFLAAGADPAFSWQQSILNSVNQTSASVTADFVLTGLGAATSTDFVLA